MVRDCTPADINGYCDALPDPQDSSDHGTGLAAIVTGNNNMNDPFRGVTGITTDSFKISLPVGGTSQGAWITGTENAVSVGDRVIFGGFGGGPGYDSPIALASDAAFDANSVVLYVAGNRGPSPGSVTTPADAHKVLAVGAYTILTNNLADYSGSGPTADGRVKPDITLPTDTLTASNRGDMATDYMTGTSGAVPYAAGAAMLYLNWYKQYGSFDAGNVYALMIAAGGNASTWSAYDNNEGAGRLKTLYNGNLHSWKVAVGHGQSVDLTFKINTSRRKIKAAVWWPEGASQAHNDIDFYMFNPNGQSVGGSAGTGTVFEKLNYTDIKAIPQGTWRVQLRGYSVPAGPQTVYVAVFQQT
jgi:hypothetical protein